jgi:hypothetical protein
VVGIAGGRCGAYVLRMEMVVVVGWRSVAALHKDVHARLFVFLVHST